MKSLSRLAIAALLAAVASTATAAVTDYAFDSVTRFDIKTNEISISGVLRNTTTPTTVTFIENTNPDFAYRVSRCIPVLLTMTEKPGRYYLNITIDTAQPNIQLTSCGLELRN